jgi:nitrite reductase/ring-hydroxylating ferredoxin subunit
MQSFDTNKPATEQLMDTPTFIDAGRVDDFPMGTCKAFDLPEGRELALYNVNGEFYATENFCPHKGAALADGFLCEHVIECGLHGWQFDVRSGQCLTVTEKLRTYEVLVEDGLIRVVI